MSSKSGGAKKKTTNGTAFKVVADNRKARHLYFLKNVLEAGLVLLGSEVKSLRQGQVSLNEAYVEPRGGELFLVNSSIATYKQANAFASHASTRPRKLLLHAKEVKRFVQAAERQGMTIIPLRLYFTSKGRAKIEVALGEGKKLYDKRDVEKQRDWDKQKRRLLKTHTN